MTEYGLEEVLTLIEENGLEREVFMRLFRDSFFIADELTADDCAEVFGKTVADTKYFIFRDKEDKGEWVQIDGNLFIDLKAMIDEDKVRTLYIKTDVVELEIRTDARRERMFTTIAKHCYGVEV